MQMSVHGGGYQPGLVICDRYEVLDIIGTGGMGKVVRVRDLTLYNEIIALKLLSSELAEDPVQFARFRNEVLLARKLAHPNIVRIYDFGSAGENYHFISMEYVGGGNLGKQIHKISPEALTFEESLRILVEICKGLSFAHRYGIIHRDLKPDNILLGEFGEIKISDFGLACSLSIDMGLTDSGQTVGTPFYMAPEQFRGEKVDRRTDIYSLGIMAYEMVVGRRPFADDNYLQLVRLHHEQPIENFATAESGIPLWFQNIVHKCTEKKCDDRYDSIDEVLSDLLANANDQGNFSVKRQSAILSFYVPVKKLKKHRSFIKALLRNCMFVLLFAIVFFGSIILMKHHPVLRQPAEIFIFRIERGLQVDLSKMRKAIGSRLNDADFFKYVENGEIGEVSALIDIGLDINSVNSLGRSALELAVENRQAAVVRLLLNKGAKTNTSNSTETPLLIKASEIGNAEIVGLLLAHNANILSRGVDGNTPLMAAAKKGNSEVAEILIKNKSPLDLRNTEGQTALHVAVLSEKVEMIQLLLDRKVNPNIQDIHGDTALITAAKKRKTDILKMLLLAGADPFIANFESKTAIDYAAKSDRLLLQRQHKTNKVGKN